MIYHSCKIKQVPFQADEISKTEPEKGVDGNGFKAIVVLPRGTSTDLMTCHTKSYDDKLLTAKNKWLIAHEEAGIEGAVCGLKGENIDLAK